MIVVMVIVVVSGHGFEPQVLRHSGARVSANPESIIPSYLEGEVIGIR
jgi:hypothetical protein